MAEVRQAVIIIHGIGEQKPMDTLRGFVDSVLPEPKEHQKPKFWSKPDKMSESFELRRLAARQASGRPRTDFYEYYWAYHMSGTNFGHVLVWIADLLLRRPKRVPKRIKWVWFLSWVLILLTIFLIFTGWFPSFSGGEMIGNNFLWGLLSTGLLSLLNGVVLKFVGDAARYMTPKPENIAQRQKIRSDGIRLLRNLHESKKYDRIVVVGHSLGSVIAYDIVRHLWTEFNQIHGKPDNFRQDVLKGLKTAIKALDPGHVDEYQKYQQDLWFEQRAIGNTWLVTDLITVGSPLASAEMLLTHSNFELKELQDELDLPTCPPKPDPLDNRSYSYKFFPPYLNSSGEKRTVRVLHHAAPFACTRWTNIYYPGDFVGGSISQNFGEGIKDLEVRVKGSNFLSLLPMTHTWYWGKKSHKVSKKKNYRKELAIETLKEALDLDCLSWPESFSALDETAAEDISAA